MLLNGMLALDMGVPAKTIDPYVRQLQVVFVGHKHSDHFNRAAIARISWRRPTVRFCGGPWMVPLFQSAGVADTQIDLLREGYWYDYNGFQVSPVPLVHDVPNYGLKIRIGGETVFYAVDTATLGGVEAKNYDLYLVEGNYGETEIQERIQRKVAAGVYAYEVDAMRRHMSKEDAETWIATQAGPSSRFQLLHGHIDKEEEDA